MAFDDIAWTDTKEAVRTAREEDRERRPPAKPSPKEIVRKAKLLVESLPDGEEKAKLLAALGEAESAFLLRANDREAEAKRRLGIIQSLKPIGV